MIHGKQVTADKIFTLTVVYKSIKIS